jgi:hypothetical protein
MTSYVPLASALDIGTSAWQNVYQNDSNTLESKIRVLNGSASKKSLPNKGAGSTSFINLDQNILMTTVVLTLKIKKTDLPTNAYLPKGWGYLAVNRYKFKMGSSQPLEIKGVHAMVKNMCDAESGSKLEYMIQLGGEEYRGNPAEVKGDFITATVLMYLPFSNLSSSRHMPYDSSLLSSPCELEIELETAQRLFTYNSGDAATVVPELVTFDYADAYLMCKQAIFMDGPASSIKPDVSILGDAAYSYGFMYPQEFSRDVDVNQANGSVTVALSNFNSGVLQSMDVFVERLFYDDTNPMSASASNKLYWVPIRNCRLEYGGNSVYRSDDSTGEMFSLSENTLIPYYSSSVPAYDTTTGIGASKSITSVFTHIQLSQYSELVFTNLAQTGVNFVSNEPVLKFELPTPAELNYADLVPVPTSYPAKVRVKVNYNYLAVARTYKGDTQLLFNTPSI